VGGGGKAANQQKISSVSATAWGFGPEDLVKTKFIIIYCKKSMERVSKSVEKFKIASLEQNYSSLNFS
jgi:hypothetical protein